MKIPFVSILVPVYGVEDYIAECAESLFEQTYDNIEYIFVNDCTPDRSLEVLGRTADRYPERKIKIINNSQNAGLATSRNVALNAATGDYICFVDSDDLLPRIAIELMVSIAEQSQADIVRGRIVRFSDEGEELFSRQQPNDIIAFRKALLDWGCFPLGVWGGIYKRNLFTDNNLTFYDGLNFGEDFGMSCRVAYFAKKVAVIDDIVYKYRVNQQSMTQAYKERNAIDLFEISDRIKAFYDSKPDKAVYQDVVKRGRARLKTITLLQLSPEISPKYANIFPDLKDASDLPFLLRLKLRVMEHNNRNIYKIIHKIEGLFQ